MLIFASIMLIILGLLTYYYYYLDSTHAVTRQHEERVEIARTVAQSIYGNWTYSNGVLEITLHNPTAYPAPVIGVLVVYEDRDAQIFITQDTVIPPASTQTIRLTELREEPNSVIIAYNIEGVAYSSPLHVLGLGGLVTTQPTANNTWHYRIVLAVESVRDRLNWPVAIHLDFTQILASLNIIGTLDVNSIRVFDAQGNPVLYNFTADPWFDPRISASGWLVFEAPILRKGNNIFYIYFDIVENGAKSPPASFYGIGIFYWSGSAVYDDYYIVLTTSLEGFMRYVPGGALLVYGDDTSVLYDFPFVFELYGINVSSLYVSTNGIIREFLRWDYLDRSSMLRETMGLYGYWDDLYALGNNYGIYHAGTYQSHLVWVDTIWWYTVFYNNLDAVADFTITVAETGDIIVQYRNIEFADGTFHAGISAGDGINYIYFDGTDYSALIGRTLIYLYRPHLSTTIASIEAGSWNLG